MLGVSEMNFSGLLAKLMGRETPRPLDQPMRFDESTFSRPGQDGFAAAWSDVRKIVGYKIDLLMVDEIRMDFQLATNVTVVITEENLGFSEFMVEVERRFQSVAGWHAKVSQPPFAVSATVLYESLN